MSRSGRIPISIPESTEVRIENNIIFAKGKLGELSFDFKTNAKVEIKENMIHVNKSSNSIATSTECAEKPMCRMIPLFFASIRKESIPPGATACSTSSRVVMACS